MDGGKRGGETVGQTGFIQRSGLNRGDSDPLAQAHARARKSALDRSRVARLVDDRVLRLLAAEVQRLHDESTVQAEQVRPDGSEAPYVNFLDHMQRVLLDYAAKPEGMRVVLDQEVESGMAHEAAVERSQAGIHEVTAGYDDSPFVGCPDEWGEKLFARIKFYSDRGDPSVGYFPQFGWTLAEDQSGTVIADLAAASQVDRERVR